MRSSLPRRLRARATLTILALLGLSAGAVADTETLDLDAYAGKVVVVDFWASWCVPCRRSFPWLNEMHARYADQGLVIIGVNVDASTDDARQFLAEIPADFAVHFDPDGELARRFDVAAMPSTYVYGRDGALHARHLGFRVGERDDYERTLQTLLQAPGARE